MKISAGRGVALGFACSLSITNAADNLRFSGALVAEPCVIPTGQEVVTLDFGSVVDKDLYLNQRTPAVPFDINLIECDVSLGAALTLTFLGNESRSLPGYLALTAGSRAGGVAIGLENADGKMLPLNKQGDKINLAPGNNRIGLRAFLQGEPQALKNKTISRGEFSAALTFGLDYQ
ncbi:fimbrial protein [Serratia marcescens]|uniref:fimbrial protein n=1 Tax=Serratia marcescens TaxID=615 RepID=UPI0033214D3C